MEHFPVEVVGEILSCISSARDVVLASGTCRRWRRAFREHLRSLSFKSTDWHGFEKFSVTKAEVVITQTIFHTTRLQSLHIQMTHLDGGFAVSMVTGWLLHTRKSLLELFYDVRTNPPLNVLEICGREKLEKATFAGLDVVKCVKPKYHRFTSLRSLSLRCVCFADRDLGALLAACPKLERLELLELNCGKEPIKKLELKAPNLRNFYGEMICLNQGRS